MGLLKSILLALLALAVLLAAVGGVLYASDYGLEAKVTNKSCQGANLPFVSDRNTSWVTVSTRVGGIRYTATGLSSSACNAVQPGNFIVYHVRSGRTSLYQSAGGPCIWDTQGGPNGCP